MKKELIVYLSGFLIVFSACSGFEKTLKSSDYKFKYNEAMRYYNEGDYYRAQTLFDQIAPVFRGAEQADTVYYYQAMSYFKQKDYLMAGHYFSNFSNTYGGSPLVEEADFMTAYCYYMNSPRPELDQDYTAQSIQNFHLYIIKYPKSNRVPEAKEFLKELQDKLVNKSFISAKLYFDLEYYKSSLIALNNSLLEYPESKYREEIMFMILKSSFMLADKSVPAKKRERFQDSIDDYYTFKSEFPDSKYIREAERFYKEAYKYLGGEIENEEELN
jgi:outer membrane protein assembly factor BamD